MRVILQQEVANLGKVGDQVSVKAGYGRNYLLPQGMAVLATQKNIADFEVRRAELEKTAAEVLANAKSRAEKLAALEIIITMQAGDEGKLFGSVSPRDISDAITQQGVKIEKKEVQMPEGSIRQTGEFTVQLKLHSEVTVPVKLKVVGDSNSRQSR
jgi:large subunit ribosomal protein L9